VAGVKTLLIAALALGSASGLAAQDAADPITTDRPDFTESSTLVPKGRLQLEGGATFTGISRDDGSGSTRSWPELLLRYGLTSRVELRVAQSLATVIPAHTAVADFTEAEDLYLGVKVGLGAQQGVRPELAMMVQATIPTGGSRLTAVDVLPGAALLAGWELSPRYSLAAGVQANRMPGDLSGLAPSITVGRSFSPRVKGYAEFYSLIPVASDGEAESSHYFNGGVGVLLSPELQLDARIGTGVNAAADRYFVGFGFAIRW
jgi:hypothetical protein